MSRPLEHIPDDIPELVRQQEMAHGHIGRRGLPRPMEYACYRATEPITVDGRIAESCWQKAPWLGPFVDMEYGTPTEYDTQVAFLWDDNGFYAAFKLEEPDVFGRETRRDENIAGDCEFELFILGAGVYYELQLNALNIPYEVFWTWMKPLVAANDVEGVNTLLRTRRAIYGDMRDDYPGRHGSFDWDFPGLQTAVQIDGSLNCRNIRDNGWTAEVGLPWSGWADLARGMKAIPPRDGDIWRMGCSRVEHWRDEEGKTLRSRDWSFCNHGKIQMHVPDRWPYIRFVDKPVGTV
jgi:hypothetical protein